MELDPEVEDEDPEEGDRLDLPCSLDKPGLTGELDDLLGGEEAGARLLDPPRVGARCGILSRWSVMNEAHRCQWKPTEAGPALIQIPSLTKWRRIRTRESTDWVR